MLWLWTLRDVAIIGIGLLLSVLALAQSGFLPPLVVTVLFAFLSIRVEDASILDFLRYAVCFLFLKQQYHTRRSGTDHLSGPYQRAARRSPRDGGAVEHQ